MKRHFFKYHLCSKHDVTLRTDSVKTFGVHMMSGEYQRAGLGSDAERRTAKYKSQQSICCVLSCRLGGFTLYMWY